MLKGTLIHPDILRVLGRCGHGSRILIADGNYPFATTLGPNTEMVSLNLSPGLVSGTDVLKALVTAIPVEAAAVMQTLKSGPYAMKGDPDIWADYLAILRGAGYAGELEQIERFKFYETAAQPNVAMTVATGEQRIYANLLLTVGVVTPGS
ncbi:MAG: RbsD/FucU family protein [Phycisphaeraceae bacterium]